MAKSSICLVDFLLTIDEEKVSSKLLEHASMAVLDNIACGVYGSQQAWGKIVSKFVLDEGTHGKATLFGSNRSVSAARAAFANGTSTHGFELDDIVQGALTHPGAVVVSAGLAAAEQSGASGKRLLLGVIAGYEVMARLGRALGSEHNTNGFHTTGVAGSVAAAVTAGIVWQLSREQLLSAIGISCSMSSGIKAFTQGTGGMVKRMHAGHAAESGVVACELARRGFTGPSEGVDGRFGLLEVIGGSDIRPQELDIKLGEIFAITQIWVKAYPCCGLLHSSANALESLKKEHHLTTALIHEIVIGTGERAVDQNSDPDPREPMTAQYSLQYSAGVAIAKDARDPQAYAQENLFDSDVRAVAAKTRLTVDSEMNALFPAHFASRVVVKTTDGRTLERTIIDPKGTIVDPLSFNEIGEKFARLTSIVKDTASIQKIRLAVRDLAHEPNLKVLSAALLAGNLSR